MDTSKLEKIIENGGHETPENWYTLYQNKKSEQYYIASQSNYSGCREQIYKINEQEAKKIIETNDYDEQCKLLEETYVMYAY